MAKRPLADYLRSLTAKVRVETEAQFAEVVIEAFDSVKFGSPITGAPGQPVDTGNLRNSFQFEFSSPFHARISTNVEYAKFVEDGIGRGGAVRYGQKNGIGGSHSVKLTILGMPKIVAVVRARRKAA